MHGIKSEKIFIRNIIGNYVAELGEAYANLVVVNADLMGTSRNQSFVERFPTRAFNVGIAEQNLVSFAAGLAHEGYVPLIFTMAPFMSMRACEQVRTDVAYANANVKMIASYSGVSGGISGATHWAIEDCAIMTGIPGITVIEPSDAVQAKCLLKQSIDLYGPVYFRISVEAQENLYSENKEFEIGKATLLSDGKDGAFICSGVTVQFAMRAAKRIKKDYNKEIKVLDMHTLKPIDTLAILEAAKTGRIVVAQDHNVIGGLGYAVKSVIAENGLSVKIKVSGIPDKFVAMAHAPYLYHEFGYDEEGLITAMKELLEI